MASERGRSAWWMIWNNLKRSLFRLPPRGQLVGSDENGTKYYEIPAEPERGKRFPVRYYVTKEKDDFEMPLPCEWEAWLRGRRKDPPTDEEHLRNLAIQHMKEENAQKKKLEESHRKDQIGVNAENQKREYPVYDEYEREPGKTPPGSKNQR